MEEKFRDLLEEGEKILWCGRPEAFETMDKTNRNGIIAGLVIKAVVVAVLLVLYLITTGLAGAKAGFIICLLVLGAIIMANPFLVARRLRNKTLYALSNRRILRCGSNSGGVPYDRIKTASLKQDADGHTTLLCGPEMQNLKSRSWRIYADVGFLNNADAAECDRAILYALPMDEDLSALLHNYLPID